ncbi:MAG: hypothetical protein R2769_08720 [Saprospiraceae bacterium]
MNPSRVPGVFIFVTTTPADPVNPEIHTLPFQYSCYIFAQMWVVAGNDIGIQVHGDHCTLQF